MLKMSNKTYDTLKWITWILLPALEVLIAGIFSLYGLPNGEKVVGTIALIDAFLGTLLKKSSDAYTGDGELIVDTSNPDRDIYSIAIEDYPEVLADKDQVMLKVKHPEHMKES